jgi:hypothetical protein
MKTKVNTVKKKSVAWRQKNMLRAKAVRLAQLADIKMEQAAAQKGKAVEFMKKVSAEA